MSSHPKYAQVLPHAREWAPLLSAHPSSAPDKAADALREHRNMRQEEAELLAAFQQDHRLSTRLEEFSKRSRSKIAHLNNDKDEPKAERMIQTMKEHLSSLRARIGSDSTIFQQLNKEASSAG